MSAAAFHAQHLASPAVGKSRQVPASSGQLPMPTQFRSAPADTPSSVVRAIETDAQALAVAMLGAGAKCAYIAACVGKSEGYISRLRSGKRQIPESLVRRLCLATGSNLLAQVRALRSALNGDPQSINAGLAARLREVA